MIGCDKKLCDFSECDLLVLSTSLTREISKIVSDVDTLSMLADLFSSIGDNLTLVAGQRERCAKQSTSSNVSINEKSKVKADPRPESPRQKIPADAHKSDKV